jgi:S-DNA-T family DNA segregation ATPase FtsK/SpoIIIE
MESRIIIDTGGAENLLGAGDMLYQSAAMSKPARIQSAYISEKEIKSVVDYLTKEYENDIPHTLDMEKAGQDKNVLFEADISNSNSDDVDPEDGLYEEARELVIKSNKASTSYLQRMLRIGYGRAARIMDMLEREGVIGPQDGSRPREVLVDGSESGSGVESNDEE